jgi:UDP-4-amino-4-deoxy-L-arabinose formyltransferase/UDP-glucuronic acid dehydrogenase (UDP-4-keto-hexauronic acid decarboxylating)
MKAVVFAYHQMGCTGLRALFRRRLEVAAIFTHKNDPGENCWFESVEEIARNARIPVFTTAGVNRPEWLERIRGWSPELIFSFNYRRLLCRELLEIPRLGAVNLHASLLPKYRGRCPINWQLIHGEKRSGVTLHHMTERADAGDIIDQEAVAVGPEDNAMDLYRKLIPAAVSVIERRLEGLFSGTAPRRAQDESQASNFGARRPEDGRIDWSRSAVEIHNLVRAVAPPWPGAFADGKDGRLMVYRSRPHAAVPGLPAPAPGERADREGVTYAGTGAGLLELLEFEILPPGVDPDGSNSAPAISRKSTT